MNVTAVEVQGIKILLTYDDGVTRTYNLEEAVSIDETNITGEFVRQANLQGWWGIYQEQALDFLRRSETDFGFFAANSAKDMRLKLSGEKATEGKIKELVESDPLYMAYQAKVNLAKHVAELFKVGLKAVEERGNMLVSLGAQMRAEMSVLGMNTKV